MLPRLTREQVREIDRRAIADYGIPGIVLMENAARSATEVAMHLLAGLDQPAVGILCGGGNNGGDGYAIARHLHNRGVRVTTFQCWSDPLKGDAAINYDIVRRMKLPTATLHDLDAAIGTFDLWIDAIFGTGLTRPIGEPLAGVIDRVNADRSPILAIDVPSGLDCNTGQPLGPCIRARRTVTFVAPKAGFANPTAADYTGTVSVGDIGAPPELITAVAGQA